jgi:serine/threonine protein phosphatase PrpC
MNAECYGSSRPQEGRQQTLNQDGFLIGRSPIPWAAVCDGAGNAQSVARRALLLLKARIDEASLAALLRDDTWIEFVESIDRLLTGGPETTIVTAAVIGDQLVGVSAGNSRAYLVPFERPVRILTSSAPGARLGSGDAEGRSFTGTLAPRDILLLLSDGAWTPLGTAGIERSVRSMTMKAFVDLPAAVLDAASKHGRTDDMTAVALRVVRG